MSDWEFTTIKTMNGVFETGGHGVSYVGDGESPYEFVVLAETDRPPGFCGVYGYGHTEEQAKEDALKKVAEFEDYWLTYL